MSRPALFALLLLPLAACTPRDPQRTDAFDEMRPADTTAAAHDTTAHGTHTAPSAPVPSDVRAETIAEYDAAAAAPQPNLNSRSMRGMPIPDTATKGWAATGRQYRTPGAAH